MGSECSGEERYLIPVYSISPQEKLYYFLFTDISIVRHDGGLIDSYYKLIICPDKDLRGN